MDAPQFIENNAQGIIDDMVSYYESLVQKTLQPAQVERLLINAFAYRENILRAEINDAALMNLVSFSRAPMLDYLGELLGVTRLTASAAVCSLELVLTAGHGNIVIPSGTRIQTLDGNVVFALDIDTPVDNLTNSVIVSSTCLTDGAVGNSYAINAVTIILDPQPYLHSASNTDVTSGGADDETDDELRTRIKLAPQSFSNAGSTGAYKYFARSANPGIVDVSVTSPIPGQVNIYPLMENGELPNAEVLTQVFNACNAEKVRPLTDTVIVQAPTQIDYSIDVALTLITGSVPSDEITLATKSLTDYAKSRKVKCGLDIVLDKIIQQSMGDNVYSVAVNQPMSTIVINDDEIANYTSINVSLAGYSNE